MAHNDCMSLKLAREVLTWKTTSLLCQFRFANANIILTMGKREWLSKVFKVLASLAAICKSNSGAVQATTLGLTPFLHHRIRQVLPIVAQPHRDIPTSDTGWNANTTYSIIRWGMFQYDGETIEELPMTAESLLSSSVRVTENSVMVGGKEIQSYGVDLNTGKILYSCSTEGCNRVRKNEVNAAGQDLLVITRNTQTVRAVDIHSGSEKWNFSVGQHELLFVGGVQKEKPQIDVDGSESDITIATCESSEEELKFEEEEQMKRYLKFMVPDGKVIGLNPNDPSHISWQHKFPSPVAKVWMLHQGHLEVMSLFDSKHIPALSSFQHPDPSSSDPLLYVGKHQNQLYVQPSDVYEMGLSERLQLYQRPQKREEPGSMVHLPRVTWKPYLNTAGFRTPTLGGNQPPDTPLLDYTNGFDLTEEDAEHGTSLTIWSEHYPFDNGFYLYPNYHDAKECLDPNWQLGVKPEEESLINMASFWIWWKEVVVISLLTSVFVHIILTRCVHHPLKSATAEEKTSSGSLVSEDSKPTLAVVQPPADYQSRFATDFECLECLGKGGFGIVFKAKNKVDDQQYAVKRISLPKSEGAKDKVLREVKALAKLEHVGIVRFFHAWVESPPPGWQEEKDKELNTGHPNIFFAMDGTVKVGDFGLVTALAENVEENNPSSTFTTSTKHTADVGTQLYMSPEQVQKKSYDQMVDVFSLGVILLELLMPFSTGMERITTLQNARKGKFPERFCRELPVESTLVQSLMSDDPKLRPTTQKILEHNILRDFSSRRTNVRSRTISSGSSDPNSPV
ncbi:hypothetical protein C0Q70_09463 [Pomacea canaliculata]|uniref:PRKR-like endoplasmic reticulum kinase n=1 Tax=Pomacea canaliculata TaxID=400727 RepID=A0A2T7P9W9_POMCA|nr:hypothetical protein C0Q70_09463 [Pomacea canaliculata]